MKDKEFERKDFRRNDIIYCFNNEVLTVLDRHRAEYKGVVTTIEYIYPAIKKVKRKKCTIANRLTKNDSLLFVKNYREKLRHQYYMKMNNRCNTLSNTIGR